MSDYGQLELRILAHVSACRSMIESFRAGGDFHSRTAMAMYPEIARAVEKGEVLLEWDTALNGPPPVPLIKDRFSAQRRRAKTLNFSIAYGKTAVGLARDWNVSVGEAKETLDRWYADRPEVRAWQTEVINIARETGSTRTLLGRQRPLPLLRDSRISFRKHAERAAINTPIQGGAADIVMAAMLRIASDEQLRASKWTMVNQIHDEVILEGPAESAPAAMERVKAIMSNEWWPGLRTGPLLVDLDVHAGIGATWFKAK